MLGRWITIQIATLTVADAQALVRSIQADLIAWR